MSIESSLHVIYGWRSKKVGKIEEYIQKVKANGDPNFCAMEYMWSIIGTGKRDLNYVVDPICSEYEYIGLMLCDCDPDEYHSMTLDDDHIGSLRAELPLKLSFAGFDYDDMVKQFGEPKVYMYIHQY